MLILPGLPQRGRYSPRQLFILIHLGSKKGAAQNSANALRLLGHLLAISALDTTGVIAREFACWMPCGVTTNTGSRAGQAGDIAWV